MNQISENALIKRINRRLRDDDCILRKSRGVRQRLDVGWYWIHEYSRNLTLDTHVDPEAFGRELGVLAQWEELAD